MISSAVPAALYDSEMIGSCEGGGGGGGEVEDVAEVEEVAVAVASAARHLDLRPLDQRVGQRHLRRAAARHEARVVVDRADDVHRVGEVALDLVEHVLRRAAQHDRARLQRGWWRWGEGEGSWGVIRLHAPFLPQRATTLLVLEVL